MMSSASYDLFVISQRTEKTDSLTRILEHVEDCQVMKSFIAYKVIMQFRTKQPLECQSVFQEFKVGVLLLSNQLCDLLEHFVIVSTFIHCYRCFPLNSSILQDLHGLKFKLCMYYVATYFH